MVVDGQTVVRSLFDRVIFIIRRKNLNSPEYRITAVKEIRKSTKLTEKHYKIIEQQTTSTEDVILEKEN